MNSSLQAQAPSVPTEQAGKAVLDWQPIETAPDGKVLVIDTYGDISVAERFSDGWTAIAAGLYVKSTTPNTGHTWEMVYPTHWMPLPAPPSAKAAEAGQ